MKLSDQALGAIMMALQKSLLEQSDIVPVLKDFKFEKAPDVKKWGGTGELIVSNPPTFKISPTVVTTETEYSEFN